MTQENIRNQPLCNNCLNVKVSDCEDCCGTGNRDKPYGVECLECGGTGKLRTFPWRAVGGLGATGEEQNWWLGGWSVENGCEGVGYYIFKRRVWISDGNDEFAWWAHCLRLADCGTEEDARCYGDWNWLDDQCVFGTFGECEKRIRNTTQADIEGAVLNNTDRESDTRTLFRILFGGEPTESAEQSETGA